MDMTHFEPAERKLQRIKINLLRDPRFAFWRGIMMVGTTEVTDKIDTACTDGCNEKYGRAFLMAQNDKQVALTILHENLHKLGQHLRIFENLFKIDPQVANLACDYYINQLLVDMDPLQQTVQMPTNPDGSRLGVLDERFRGVSILDIFRTLLQEKQGKFGAFAPGAPDQGEMDEHDWDGANARGEEEQKKLTREVTQALRQGEIAHRRANGGGEGALSRHLSELLQPKVDWRDALSQFIHRQCSGRDFSSFRRPNRRFLAMDIIMPSMISERIGRIGLGGDMSGSVTQPQQNAIISEMVHLTSQVKPEKVDVMYWDTRVARHEEYNEDNMGLLATTTRPVGGGGTSPECVKRFLKEQRIELECLIMLTDGYVDRWPEFDCPTLWVITTKGITAPTGITVHMDDVN